MQPRLEIDRSADAAYVLFSAQPVQRTTRLDARRLVDYDAAGELVGIEFLALRRGVDLSGLPNREELARLFEGHDIRQFV
jgi:uncharacterized protein YuzE